MPLAVRWRTGPLGRVRRFPSISRVEACSIRPGRQMGGGSIGQAARRAVGPIDGSGHGLDILFACLVIEILDSPFWKDEVRVSRGRKDDNLSGDHRAHAPGTASLSSSLANFIAVYPSSVAVCFDLQEPGDASAVEVPAAAASRLPEVARPHETVASRPKR